MYAFQIFMRLLPALEWKDCEQHSLPAHQTVFGSIRSVPCYGMHLNVLRWMKTQCVPCGNNGSFLLQTVQGVD